MLPVSTAFTLLATGCVIGEPDFTPPAQTRPQLLAVTPATTELQRIPKSESNTFSRIDFTVQLLSEDAGEDVLAVMFLNYGHPSPFLPGAPFEQKVDADVWPAGTLADGPRQLTLSWTPNLVNDQHDCKSITILATHKKYQVAPFDECPSDITDSDTLTWFVSFCNDLGDCSVDDCLADRPPEGYRYCPEDPAAAEIISP